MYVCVCVCIYIYKDTDIIQMCVHIEIHRLEPQKELTALAFIRLVGAVHLVPWLGRGPGLLQGGFPVVIGV